jgi:hypothetical protein
MTRRIDLLMLLLIAPLAASAQGAPEPRTLQSFGRDMATWPLKDVPYQLWHYSTNVMMNGSVMFAREFETCRSINDARQCNFDRPGSGCKAFDLGSTATTQKIRMECKDMQGEMTATWNEDGRNWKADFLAKGAQIPPGATMAIEARYLRPCAAGDVVAGQQPPR